MTSTAGDWRSIAAWLGVLATLACGRADDAQRSSPPIEVRSRMESEPAASVPSESSTSDDDTNDTGASLPSGDSAECPAPRPEATPNGPRGWARDPATGTCCAYRNRTAAPNGWLRFDSEGDCKTRCLCSALEGFEGDFEDLVYVPDSLECHCSRVSCPSTLEEAEQTLCSVTIPPAAVQRLVGCGMVVVRDRNGSSGYEWVFEQTSEAGDAAAPASRLVGASEFSDASSTEACTTSSWSAGRDFFEECDAAEVVHCQLCGDSTGPEYPPCQ
jgi:hypothetical protein